MRARAMTAKLDRLPIHEEIKVWDLSLLSPEDQDRAKDLMDLIRGSTDIEAEGLNAAINEFENLVEGLPLLGENDRRQGPKIEVPRSLAYYWQRRQHASEKSPDTPICRIVRTVWLPRGKHPRDGSNRRMGGG